MRLKLEGIDGVEAPPSTPKQVAIKVGIITALILLVGGIVVMTALGNTSQPFERGMRLGFGVTPLVLLSAGIGYLVQARRLRQS